MNNLRRLNWRLLPPDEPEETGDLRPSLLLWRGYALLGLLTAIGLTASVLVLLRIA